MSSSPQTQVDQSAWYATPAEVHDSLGNVVNYTIEDNAMYENYDPELESMKYGDEDEAAKSNRSVVTEFIKQLRPGMELYRVSVPAFILQPISLLEKISIYATPTPVLHKLCTQGQDLSAKERMLLLTNWMLSTWKSIPRFGIQEVKPFNPIIGEQFHCAFDHADEDGSQSVYVAEQVHHHPPVTAFHLENKQRQFKYYGWVYPKILFGMNSFTTYCEGDIRVELGKNKETYKLSYPPIKASGIIFGTRMISLTETLEISCEDTGFKTVIRFTSQNKDNIVDGEITDITGSKTFYRIKGVVNGVVRYKDVDVPLQESQSTAAPSASPSSQSSGHKREKSTGGWFNYIAGGISTVANAVAGAASSTSGVSSPSDEDISDWPILFDAVELASKKIKKVIAPIHEQQWNHSRRLWHLSAQALRKQNFDLAQAEKHVVEQAQRDKKIDEELWQQSLFKLDENNNWRVVPHALDSK